MPPRRKQGAKLRSARVAAAAKAKKNAEEEKLAEETTAEETKEEVAVVEDSAVEAGSSELDNTGTDLSQDPITEEETGVAEEDGNISAEIPVEEVEGDADGIKEEFTEVLEETWANEQGPNDEDNNVNEDEILADDEQVDISQEEGEELEDTMDQSAEDVLLADDELVEEAVEEDVEEAVENEGEAVENEGEAEEMEVTEVDESGDLSNEKTDEKDLFTIDKTPMDMEEVASKMDKKTPQKKPGKRVAATKVQKGKSSKPSTQTSPIKKDNKSSEADPKKKPEEQTVPLRGRVLKLAPLNLAHLTSYVAAPILRASIGYIIRVNENGQSKQQGLARSLEIWFHSEEEAEEMFVKFCNFNWNVNGKLTRIVRVNNVQETDLSLREWDKTISPFGLYDGRCMFVSNLPTDTTREQVMGLFSKATKIQLPTDKDGKSEGYAILEFSTQAARSESSKLTVKLGDNELKLHMVGMQRTPRSKAAQEKLDEDFRKVRQQGYDTSLSSHKRPARDQNRGRADSSGGRQTGRPGQLNQRQGNQRPGQGNQRPGQGNQRPGQGNQGRPGQANQQNKTGQGRGNQRSRSRSSNNNQKRGAAGGRDDSSPMKRGRMDRGQRNQGNSAVTRGMNYMGGHREMQLRQEMMRAQQSMLAQQISPAIMSRNRQALGGNRRSMPNDVQNIRGELLGQMQNLQQGGLSDPTYLMNLAQRLQQAQGGGAGYGNY